MIDVSVVVPTRNRAKSLKRMLESLINQTLPQEKYEVIVIDNGSKDDTNIVCAEYKNRIRNFSYIYNDVPGLHVGRNMGITESKGDIIVYADDDIVAFDTWLLSIRSVFEKIPKVVLVGGNDIPKFEGDVPEWFGGLWEEVDGINILGTYSCLLFDGDNRYIDPYFVYGCNFAIRKTILKKCGGFHPDGMPDDYLCFRGDGESYVSGYIKSKTSYKAYYCKEASVYHFVGAERLTPEYFDKVSYRQGISWMYRMLREWGIVLCLVKLLWDWIKPYGEGKFNSIEILKRKRKCQNKGKFFLLNKYLKSSSVRKWIHQNDYMGENGNIFAL